MSRDSEEEIIIIGGGGPKPKLADASDYDRARDMIDEAELQGLPIRFESKKE